MTGGNATAYRVSGNRMSEDGIRHGDWVLIDRDELVRDGDIAVVRRDTGTVVAHVHGDEQIIGKVMAVARRLP